MYIKRFNSWLQEAISAKNSKAANNIIERYLKRKLNSIVTMLPPEQFENSKNKGFGIRYIYDSIKCIRFNWRGKSLNVMALHSIDLWEKPNKNPDWHVEFNTEVSLVKMLPAIVDFILEKNKKIGTQIVFPSDFMKENYNDDDDDENVYIFERKENNNYLENIHNLIEILETYDSNLINEQTGELYLNNIIEQYNINVYHIIEYIRKNYSNIFIEKNNKIYYKGNINIIQENLSDIVHSFNSLNKNLLKEAKQEDFFDNLMLLLGDPEFEDRNGFINRKAIVDTFGPSTATFYSKFRNHPKYKKYFSGTTRDIKFIGDVAELEAQKNQILQDLGAKQFRITRGATDDEVGSTEFEERIEAKGGIKKVAYTMQLEHLGLLTQLVIKKASNALFVAGRGGTGKTQTVEKILADNGLQDGHGYVKITGSSSPVGIYATLFNNPDSLILFDDCDGALKDQDGRNIIKAATDTKKIRKIAWNKKGFLTQQEYELELARREEEDAQDEPWEKYPNAYEFRGNVIFISNLTLDKLDPDGALRTRGYIIEIDPTDSEMLDYMDEIKHLIPIEVEGVNSLSAAELDEVMNGVREMAKSRQKNSVTLRTLVRAVQLKAALGDKWKQLENYL